MGDQKFAMDYIDVAARIVEFRDKYPQGSLRPADLAVPYRVEKIGEQTFIVVVAAAHRGPDDALPGIGMAYEQFPGRTPYTRGSELQNAETSAWGRAIVAALAADTKRGIASADEVRNREAERDGVTQAPQQQVEQRDTSAERRELLQQIRAAADSRSIAKDEVVRDFAARTGGKQLLEGTVPELRAYLDGLTKQPSGTVERITRSQLTKLHTQLTGLRVNAEEKHDTVGVLIGRPIESTKDISKAEATTLIDLLERILAADEPQRQLEHVLAEKFNATTEGAA